MLHQLSFYEFAHRVDAFTLQAVVAANRQVQIFDRDSEFALGSSLDWSLTDFNTFSSSVEFTCQAEQLNQRRPG